MTVEGQGEEDWSERIDWTLVAIGVLKLIKCCSLVVLGASFIYWRNDDLGQVASHWLGKLWLSRAHFEHVVARLSFLDRQAIERFAVAAFVYAALLATEGVGLCLRKRWAEYLTVVITASLLPLEIYELWRRVTWTGTCITLVNVAIVVYLVVRLVQAGRGE